jgi:subtilisin family serine protease
VAHITRDTVLHPQAESSTDFLKISTAGGVWDKLGGVENAGKGIVVGDIDTGIAPESPSFKGDPLTSTPSTSKPYLSGDTVVFTKADGNTFTDTPVLGNDHFTASDLSTKIIGAQYFVDGFGASNIGTNATGEYLSPRDGDSHGSHTGSTAVGNYGVDAFVHNAATGTDVPFGKISGVAPAAKIAAYKVCWEGPDTTSDLDDGCTTTDIVAAIDAAVSDGVDVLNFSIGGTSATTTYSASDAAFMNAAAAGIFVSAAAGNAGPGATTLDNASPWETTVAASTIPTYEATATLGNGKKYAGASFTVDRETPEVTNASFVEAISVAAGTSDAAILAARLCGPNSLDATKTEGKVVLCDRGTYDRVAKSAEVARAGGIGVVMVNQPDGANDVDLDQHAVPTIHVSNKYYDALHAYAATEGATVSFTDENTSADQTPVPQIAGFSSRGPVTAAGGDILKPDISAPGVSILAATTNLTRTPSFDFFSGTSMATPHVAGLAALYLGVHPLATPMEIKSALMTTATDTVSETGTKVTDPFAQGAGEVNPTRFLNAGLFYLSTLTDWKRYIVGTGQASFAGVTAIDPSDLNTPSIAIGDLTKTQKVTRTVTSQAAGTYTGKVSVPGVTATLSPATLKFTAAGQSKTFTVTFTRTTAKLDVYAKGFLTWTKGTTTVRSPIAVHPTLVQAPPVVNGEGTSGSLSVGISTGASATIPIQPEGLAQGIISPNDADPTADFSATVDSDVDPEADFVHEVPEGTTFVRFNTHPVGSAVGVDLDLYVYYSETGDPADAVEVGSSATASANETVDISDPDPGTYFTAVVPFETPGPIPIDDVAYTLSPTTLVGNLTATPSSIKATVGGVSEYTLRWGGLDPNSQFLGFVHYGDADAVTDLFVTTGDTLAPVNLVKPSISGPLTVGSTATVDPGEWDADNDALTFTYQWVLDGEAIDGATDATYDIPDGAFLSKLGVIVTASVGADGPKKVLASAAQTVRAASTTTSVLAKTSIKAGTSTTVTVHVETTPATHTVGAAEVTNALGVVTLKVGTNTLTYTLKAANNGTAKFTLPKFSKKQSNTIKVSFAGGAYAGPSTAAPLTLVVK